MAGTSSNRTTSYCGPGLKLFVSQTGWKATPAPVPFPPAGRFRQVSPRASQTATTRGSFSDEWEPSYRSVNRLLRRRARSPSSEPAAQPPLHRATP